MATLRVRPEAQAKVDVFREDLCTKTENLLGSYFPKKISELDAFLKEPALNEADLSNLKAPLDIPVPDPVKEKEKEERKKQQEASREELGGGTQPWEKSTLGLTAKSPSLPAEGRQR